MGKRFTDTEKWKSQWFQSLAPKYKLLWAYILDNCDQAGIWPVNMSLASFQLGVDVGIGESLNALGKNVVPLSASKWFVPDFIKFQYGTLKPGHKFHAKIIKLLEEAGLAEAIQDFHPAPAKGQCNPSFSSNPEGIDTLSIQYPEGIDTHKELELELELDQEEISKDEDPRSEEVPRARKEPPPMSVDEATFEAARKAYPGTKRGRATEFANFKRHKDWRDWLPKLHAAILSESQHKAMLRQRKAFCPEWANFQTWINQRRFETEHGEIRDGADRGHRGQSESAAERQSRRLQEELAGLGFAPADDQGFDPGDVRLLQAPHPGESGFGR